MNRFATLFLAALAWAAASTGSRAADLGVVLMHGKQGTPAESALARTVRHIEDAGFGLETPTMCWTQYRIYDRSLLDCLDEIEAPIARLRQRGARQIVVAGLSLGGLGALAYGARHDGLSGVIALAPGPGPGAIRYPEIEEGLKQARELIAAGRGDEFRTFEDVNGSPRGGAVSVNVRATANIFMSFWDMNGPANIERDAGKIKAPLLWVSGSRDRSQVPRNLGFARAPQHPLSRYALVDADHMGTPDAAADIVVEWLRTLASQRH
jgi:pimeloyl-ACP methyl ester carboxylesterase